MNKYLQSTLVSVSLFFAFSVTANATASSVYTACVNEARADYNEAVFDARELFNTAKDNLLDIKQGKISVANAKTDAAEKASLIAAAGTEFTNALVAPTATRDSSINTASSTRKTAIDGCISARNTALITEYDKSNTNELKAFNRSYKALVDKFNAQSRAKAAAYKRTTGVDIAPAKVKVITLVPVV